jgi:hypothetical protein
VKKAFNLTLWAIVVWAIVQHCAIVEQRNEKPIRKVRAAA